MNTSAYLKSYAPAILVALAIAFVLRPIAAPHGMKVGIAFFGFILVHKVVADRVKGIKRSRGAWMKTLTIAFAAALAMWLISPS